MVFAFCYGTGCAAIFAVIALMLINRRPHALGLVVLGACVATFLWAAASALPWMPGISHALDSVRSGAWLLVIVLTLSAASRDESGKSRLPWVLVLAGGVAFASVLNDCRFLFRASTPTAFVASQVLGRVLVSVGGILAVENLFRNVSPGRRWNITPLCIALGAMFAYDLYLFSEAVVLKSVSPSLLAGRGLILALIAPLLVLTMARNPGLDIDVHVSRRVVFHGVTLTASGLFLVIAAVVAALIGRFPGQWASVSEIAFFCGSIIVLLVVLSTGSIRSRVRRLIAENFFSTRYDYRAEWLRTITTLSSAGADEPLPARAIRALADVVDSPGGVLWSADEAGDYRVARTIGLRFDDTPVERGTGEFIAKIRSGDAVLDFTSKAAPRPEWAGCAEAWLAVPLMKLDRLVGFVVLMPPRAPAVLNWESSDLLLAIGQQVASYLEEERATRALLETQSLIEYSRRFSFVIHDIKNISGQLELLIANFSRFGDRAEFRVDMVQTLESAAAKVRRLIERLRADAPAPQPPPLVDPAEIVAQVARELDRGETPLRTILPDHGPRTRIMPSDLESALTHLITNAIEASSQGDEVRISLRDDARNAVIEIADKGAGMTAEFIRNSLFVPRKSTKAGGHGMGAYQARHLIRAAGGELEVTSAIGRGTVMRITLPADGAVLPVTAALAS